MIETLGSPRRFNARLRPRHVRSRFSCVNQSTHGKGSHVEMFFASDFRQPQGISGRAAHYRRSEFTHHVQALDGIPPAAGNHHCADPLCSFDGGPEADEGAKRKWQKHAITGSHPRAPQDVPPAVAPPIPTLSRVHYAYGSARGARGLVDARVSVRAKGRVGPKRWCLFLRKYEFGFAGKRELLELGERMNGVGGDTRVFPFLGVETIAAGHLAKKSLQLVELYGSQALPWGRFVDLVEEGHGFLQSPKNNVISQYEIIFHICKPCRKLIQRGNSRAALSYRILRLAAAPIGSALNFSMFPLISGTPGPGQSVPHKTLSATSSIRGKYSISFCGGIPEISMYMFLCRRTRKNASFIHSGLPPCARMTARFV